MTFSISDISAPARASIGLDLDLKENQLEINASEDAAWQFSLIEHDTFGRRGQTQFRS